MRILAEDTAAVIIDYQERLMPAIKDGEEIVKNACILIKGLKVLDVPLIATQQYTKGMGMNYPEIVEAMGTEEYYDKVAFSICDNDVIMDKIREIGRRNIIVCGAESHICVLQSAIDLKAKGYTPVFVTDCSGSRRDKDKESAIDRCKFEGIMTATYEQVLMELTRKAGNDRFRAVSKLIK